MTRWPGFRASRKSLRQAVPDAGQLYSDGHDPSDEAVEYEYAALFFLAPAGFRHFLPAYMSFALRYQDSGAAVIGSRCTR